MKLKIRFAFSGDQHICVKRPHTVIFYTQLSLSVAVVACMTDSHTNQLVVLTSANVAKGVSVCTDPTFSIPIPISISGLWVLGDTEYQSYTRV